MSAINLEKSLERLSECYVGRNDDGQYVIDKSKIDDLSFKFAMFRINKAIEDKEITEGQLHDLLDEKDVSCEKKH